MFFKNRYFVRFVTSLISLGVLLGATPLPAFAGGFNHVHTDKCYKNVTKTCKNHEISVGKEYLMQHCPTCGTQRECYYETYTDVCRSGLVPNMYIGGNIRCNTCGTDISHRDFPETLTHEYKVRELACGKTTGTTAATVSVSASSTAWTNQSVVVSCSVSISDGSFSLASNPYSFNGGGFGGQSSAEVFENGTYSFTVKSSDGRTAGDSVTVGNIDKEPPHVSLSKSTGDWTEEGLTITASASDDLSGLPSEAYSFSGGFSSNNSIFVTANGTYSVTVCDNAGNTASASIEVSNIGRDPKIIEQEEEEKRKKEEEEKRKKEEEEKRKKEEEERRKKEEEDKRKKEEEERRRKEEEEKKKDEPGEDKKDDRKDDKEDKKDKPSGKIISLIEDLIKPGKDKEKEEDVTSNDISQNDTSGNMIYVDKGPSLKDLTGKKTDVKKEIKTDIVEVPAKMSLFDRFMNLASSVRMFISGLLLVVIALGIFSSLNFVYTLNEGKIKPVAVARISKNRRKLFVRIPAGPLERDKTYKVFFSLWTRLFKKDRTVVFDIDGHIPVRADEDGNSFVYSG